MNSRTSREDQQLAGWWKLSRTFLCQVWNHRRVLAAVYGVGTALLASVWFIGTRAGTSVTVGDLVRDTAQVAGLPFYTGAVSNLGIVFWSAAAAICLITARVARHQAKQDAGLYRFFLMAGILTAMLGADDLFMLHEEVFPKYLFPKRSLFHAREGMFFIAYAGFAFAKTRVESSSAYGDPELSLHILDTPFRQHAHGRS